MSICGYHPKMGGALRLFAEGLIEAVQHKATTRGVPLDSQLRSEVEEIATLESFLVSLVDQTRNSAQDYHAPMLLAVVKLAKALFGDMNLLIEHPGEFRERVSSNASTVDRVLQQFEDAFEARAGTRLDLRARLAWEETTRALSAVELSEA